MSAARRTPLIAAVPKMLFPFLVILPGMIAIALTHAGGAGFSAAARWPTAAATTTWRSRMMLAHYFPPGLLGLGLTALMASFMSGMAGNVTAFNTVWTYDIYQSYIKKDATDAHYLWVGRMATVFGHRRLAWRTAYLATQFNNIMDFLQLVFAFVNAPLFATFLLGMFWKRATGHGAFFGLVLGTLAAAVHHGLTLPDGRARRHQGRLAGGPADARLPERDGAELLDRDLGLLRLLRRHDRDLARHPPHEDRRRAARARLRPHAAAEGRAPAVVEDARGHGRAGAGAGRGAERHLLVAGGSMGLDIRTPIGLMFGMFGLLLAGYGLATSGSDLYERSLGHNINLIWGLVLLAFGGVMLWLSRKSGGKPKLPVLKRPAVRASEDDGSGLTRR